MSKKVISHAEFEKRVEMEYCYLVYMDYMKKGEAWQKARESVAEKYEVGRAEQAA